MGEPKAAGTGWPGGQHSLAHTYIYPAWCHPHGQTSAEPAFCLLSGHNAYKRKSKLDGLGAISVHGSLNFRSKGPIACSRFWCDTELISTEWLLPFYCSARSTYVQPPLLSTSQRGSLDSCLFFGEILIIRTLWETLARCLPPPQLPLSPQFLCPRREGS